MSGNGLPVEPQRGNKATMFKALRRIFQPLEPAGLKAINLSDFFFKIVDTDMSTPDQWLKYGTSKLWATWKACDLVGQSVMTTPRKVTQGNSETPVKNAELDKLLSYPNNRMTFAELLYLTTMHLKMVGNAYWLKGGVRAMTADRPNELIPLNPARVKIEVDERTGEVVAYSVRVQQQTYRLNANLVMHFKRPHPNDDYLGLGDCEAGSALLVDELNDVKRREKEGRQGGMPAAVLVNETLGTDVATWQKLKRDWSSEYTGRDNAGKIGWLAGKWNYLRLGNSPSEAQSLERQQASAKAIFQLHGVPLSVAGIENAANYATAQIDLVRYNVHTVMPMVTIIRDTMQTDLVQDWGENLRIVFELTGLINVGAVLTEILPAFDRGIVSINEIRRMIGLKDDPMNPLWEDHYINAGLTSLSLAGMANADNSADAARAITQRFIQSTLDRSGA